MLLILQFWIMCPSKKDPGFKVQLTLNVYEPPGGGYGYLATVADRSQVK